jgi:hypothetical protein
VFSARAWSSNQLAGAHKPEREAISEANPTTNKYLWRVQGVRRRKCLKIGYSEHLPLAIQYAIDRVLKKMRNPSLFLAQKSQIENQIILDYY